MTIPTCSSERTLRRRGIVCAWVVAATASIASCYDHRVPAADDVALLMLPATAVADGKTVVTIKAAIAAGTPSETVITVTVSTGVVNFAVAATDAGARQVSLKNDGTGQLAVPWVVGTRAGEAVVILAVGGATRTRSITLAPSEPAYMTLGLDTTALRLDGSAHAQATVFLGAADPTRSVSDGTAVRFGFCCLDQTGSGLPTNCPDPPPVTVPAQVTATGAVATASIGTQAVPAVAADAGRPAPTRIFLIATTMSAISCAPAPMGEARPWTSAQITLTVPSTN